MKMENLAPPRDPMDIFFDSTLGPHDIHNAGHEIIDQLSKEPNEERREELLEQFRSQITAKLAEFPQTSGSERSWRQVVFESIRRETQTRGKWS